MRFCCSPCLAQSSVVLTLRDDDDINDVASMAGVNLSEESARILATNSELVGTLTRSCKDETFLLPAPLQRRILEIGMFLLHGCHRCLRPHGSVGDMTLVLGRGQAAPPSSSPPRVCPCRTFHEVGDDGALPRACLGCAEAVQGSKW